MKKTDSKVQKYLNLQGYLEKQGDGPFVGFQVKYKQRNIGIGK